MKRQDKVDLIRDVYNNFEPTVYLFPTMKCNLNCCMCYSGSAMHKSVKDELSDEEYLNLIDNLVEQGYARFDISGGEPFLRDYLLYKLAKKIKQLGARLQVVTNGTFLVSTLKKYPFEADDFDFIAVSLDSPDEMTHNKIRGNDKAYSMAIEGIKELVAKGFTVGINAVYMSENSGQLSELLQLAKRLGVTFVHILRNRYVSPLLVSINSFDGLDWYNVYERIEESLNSMPEELFVIVTLPQYIHLNLTKRLRGRFRDKNNILIRTDCVQGCGAFNRNIVITADGFVTGCVAMINESKFRVGNIRETSISDLLSKFQDWIEQFNMRNLNLYEKSVCGHCDTFYFCKGGCPMVAEKFLANWNKSDPSCNKAYKESYVNDKIP